MITKPGDTVLWDEDSGEVFTLPTGERFRLVASGVIVWCEEHQCFHYVDCPINTNQTRH